LNPVTQKYINLPSDAGITFHGFENIVIPSREGIRKKLNDFIVTCENSNKPTLRVILAEWGEGKTDAYHRYLEPELRSRDYQPILVSASTISNSYSVPVVSKLIGSTSLSAIMFLVTVMNSAREESKINELPDASNYDDARPYLLDSFHSLLEKKSGIVVFIDEFEELLTNKQSLNKILSGLKETINGSYHEIDEGGEFEGSIHFVISATPDAFYQL